MGLGRFERAYHSSRLGAGQCHLPEKSKISYLSISLLLVFEIERQKRDFGVIDYNDGIQEDSLSFFL
jgi:hypothetical protein